jgi:hypothetical protein
MKKAKITIMNSDGVKMYFAKVLEILDPFPARQFVSNFVTVL